MTGLRPNAEDAAALAVDLPSPPPLHAQCCLLTDFDGTLVELASRPDAVRPEAGLVDCLSQLKQQLGNALAVVTGRRLADVDHYLAPLRLIGSGAHGAELRTSVSGATMPVADPLAPALIEALRHAISGLDGVWLENKAYALAVHCREQPALAHECRLRMAAVLCDVPGIELFDGHAVIEVRRTGLSKGSAVNSLLDLPVFSGRQPVFVGDDLADEECFALVQAAGGFGVKVGAGASRAAYRLEGVPAVHAWLREVLTNAREWR